MLLTPEPPTRPLVERARLNGLCAVPGFAPVNRIRIVPIEQALALRERAVEIPRGATIRS